MPLFCKLVQRIMRGIDIDRSAEEALVQQWAGVGPAGVDGRDGQRNQGHGHDPRRLAGRTAMVTVVVGVVLVVAVPAMTMRRGVVTVVLMAVRCAADIEPLFPVEGH